MPIYAQSSTLRNLTMPLLDIDQTTLADNQILQYDENTGKFVNTAFSSRNTGNFLLENVDFPSIQYHSYLLFAQTANNNETSLQLSAAGDKISITKNTTVFFQADVVGREENGANHAVYRLQGLIDRTGNNTILVNTVVENIIAESSESWTAIAEANTIDHVLEIKVSGTNFSNIRWAANVQTTKISY